MLELLVTIATGEFGSTEVLDAIEEAIDGGVELYLIDAAIEALRETNLREWFDRWPGDNKYRHVPWHGHQVHLET